MGKALFKEVSYMWLRISPKMDFYLDMELQGVTDKTSDYDVQQYEKVVYDAFVERLKKAFPEGDFKIYMFEFNVAREKQIKAA
jgi:hypothetical protein